MKTKEEKKKIVEELKDLFQKSQKFIFVSLLNINSEIQNEIKTQIKKLGGIFKVVKKNLLKLANRNINIEKEEFKQPFGVIFDLNDINNIDIFRTLLNLKEKHNIQLIEGVINNKILSSEEILEIGKLPSKEILIQRSIGTVNGLLVKFMQLLKNPLIRFNLVVSNAKK